MPYCKHPELYHVRARKWRMKMGGLLDPCIIFIQNGSFFNVYGRDAIMCHDVLGLNYTGGREEAGVPVSTIDESVAALIAARHSVVLVRQTEDTKAMKKRLLAFPTSEARVRRAISAIHTPGTYDDGLNKTIFAVQCLPDQKYDLTIYNHLQKTRKHVTCPREDLHAYALQHRPVEVLWNGPGERFQDCIARYLPKTIRRDLKEETSSQMLNRFFQAVRTGGKRSLNAGEAAPPPLDAKTLENLRPMECFSPQTRGGRQLLSTWLRTPLQDIDDIMRRQRRVAHFVDNPIERERLRQLLGYIKDTTLAKDLQDLHTWIDASTAFLESGERYVNKVVKKATKVFKVLRRVSKVTGVDLVYPDPQRTQHPLCCNAQPWMDDYRDIMVKQLGRHWNRVMNDIRFCNNAHTRFDIEVPMHHFLHMDRIVPPQGMRRSSQTKQYVRIATAKTEGFRCAFEEQVLQHHHQESTRLRTVLATFLAQDMGLETVFRLDAIVALADAAATQGWCRPVFGDTYHVEGAYTHTGDVPNDMVNWKNPLVLTGMNGSGKSTWMRTLAHVTLLAQAGSFVPATKALLPLVDHVFLRFGSSDSLIAGESSFQVEAQHALYIRRTATERSLVFIDELGSSCGATEGQLIAQAVLSQYQNTKVMFATHFRDLQGGKPYCMDKYQFVSGKATTSGAMKVFREIFDI